jgi:hypothetical protein
MLVFRLLNSAHREIFLRLCEDIVVSASTAGSEKQAVQTAIARTWRWHHLLRGGTDGRLTSSEQKGLIGEILVLEKYLLPHLSVFDALESWKGPQGAPKDFDAGRVCIEVKAADRASTSAVTINSELQLNHSDEMTLFLCVVDIGDALADSMAGVTITDVVARVRAVINARNKRAVEVFERSLLATGFSWAHDYSDSRWLVGSAQIYRVLDEFPSIVLKDVPPGVSRIIYSISLAACEPFKVNDEVLVSKLEGH